MAEENLPPGSDADIPEAAVTRKSRWKLQVIWLIPLVAVVIGGWLAVNAILQRGPMITIAFKTADGLEAEKTKLKYKDVDIGLVKSVELSKDLSTVIATAELVKDFKPHLVKDTRFWVVRPRISGGTVSGLGTLLSGSYIGVDVGRSKEADDSFTGLETPPVVQLDTPGREYTLHAEDIGSFDSGVPVFFRRLQVGQVVSYGLNMKGKGAILKVFINEPYTSFVDSNTRFWNASGVKLRMDANGLKIDTQSLVSIAIGGIAFDNPPVEEKAEPVSEKTQFSLFPDREEAMKNPETEANKFVMVFDESVRGLQVGAPVDFRGITVGEVSAFNLFVDPETHKVFSPVEVKIYTERLHSRIANRAHVASTPAEKKKLIDGMVAQGMRAQLSTGNLLTGQLYVDIDFHPEAPKAKMNWDADPPEIPTTKGNLQAIQRSIASIASKLDKMPIEKIGTSLRDTLGTANSLLQQINTQVAPELRETVRDARKALNSADQMLSPEQPLQRDARETLREVSRAANSFRILADYLERHPEAIIRGKKEDEK